MPRGWWGAVPGGGWPATVARGAWCQALSLPRPPVLWSGRPWVLRPVCPGCGRCRRGDPAPAPQRAPIAGRRCSLWGWRKGVPGGGAFHHCEGRLRPGTVPPPTARPLGRAVGVRHPRAVGAGVWVWEPNTVPLACMPCGGCMPRGWRGAVPGGGWSATAVRGAWCQALPLPRPPVLWGGQPGFRDPCVPGAVGAGVGTQHRPHSVRPCGPALLAVGVAETFPGGGAFHHCEGRLRSGAVPPPTARPLGGLLGLVGCVRCVWCLCRACRGARCRSSLVPLVLSSSVSCCDAVLAVCLPCPLPCARPLLGCWLPLVPFVASLLFTLSSTLLPRMYFFPASALVRFSVFFLAGSLFSLAGPSPLTLRIFVKAMGLAYAKPPFSLLAKVLTKIDYEGGSVVMCTPDWGCSGEHAYWRRMPDRMTVRRVQLPNDPICVPKD